MDRARRHWCCWLPMAAMAACMGCFVQPLTEPGPGAGNDDLAVFTDTDPDSSFATSDVRDIDEQIVRFDTVAKTMIWVEDGREFPDWDVDGNFLGNMFQVRFGTKDGERRAYFTEREPPTICDIEIRDDMPIIRRTPFTVPQE